jgi:hypothetical protein
MIVGFDDRFAQAIEGGTKKHTLREDKKNRYYAGCLLHLSTGVRTKNHRRLKDTVCTGIQRIQIRYGSGGYQDVFAYQDVEVTVDGRSLGSGEIGELAKNDGFETSDDFFRWFNKDYTGKIIHWTNLKY